MKKEHRILTGLILIISWALVFYGAKTEPEINITLISVGSLLNLVPLTTTFVHAYKSKAGTLWLVSLVFISVIAVPTYLITVKTSEALES